jgi:hypothetical protein
LKKKNFFSPYPLSTSARWPFQPSRPARLPAGLLTPPLLLLRGPAQSGSATATAPLSFPLPLTTRARLAAPSLTSRWTRTRAAMVKPLLPHVRSSHHGSVPPRARPSKGDPHPTLLPYCPSPLHFHSRNRTHRAAVIHRRARLPHRVSRHPRAASATFFRSVSFASLPSFFPCLHRLE